MKLSKTVYNSLINTVVRVFINIRLTLADKLNLKDPNKNMVLANLRIYYTWKNIKSEYNNNKFKINAPTWTDEFDSPDGSYSVSDIQDILFQTIRNNSPLQITLLLFLK